MSSLKVTQINKSFQQPLLQDISFTLAEPGIYGLLGRNGVGKSTLLKIITNRIFPDSGQVMLDGESLAENSAQLEKIFLMSEVNLYPKSMEVQEAIRWTARFYDGFDQVLATDLLTKFDLAPRQKIAKLSTGYQTIFKLIVALCVPAEFVLLDEPVLGLDANHREIFYHTLIENYTKRPRIFVISTHLIEEVANIINHVLILAEHQLIIDQSTDDLLERAHAVSGPAVEVDAYTQGLNVIGSEVLGGMKTIYILGDLDETRILSDLIKLERVDLQKLFIQLTTAGVAANVK